VKLTGVNHQRVFWNARCSVWLRWTCSKKHVSDVVVRERRASWTARVHRKARKVTALTRFDVLSVLRRAKFVSVEGAGKRYDPGRYTDDFPFVLQLRNERWYIFIKFKLPPKRRRRRSVNASVISTRALTSYHLYRIISSLPLFEPNVSNF
jgi:hypothetical protein